MRISGHRLLIKHPEETLDFYQTTLGMTLLKTHEVKRSTHYLLSYDETKQAVLELIHNPDQMPDIAKQPSKTEGYWKFTIAVDNLDEVRHRFLTLGVQVGQCFEVQDLAYLCHLKDPNGYSIELIQKTLPNSSNVAPLEQSKSSAGQSLNLSTLRVKDATKSIEFYHSLGMSLLYSYRSDSMNMTLYFLVGQDYKKDFQNHPAGTIEEKLWQFPFTILELQQIDGTDKDRSFCYRVGPQTGFLGLDMQCSHDRFLQLQGKTNPQHLKTDMTELTDPDGYPIRVRLISH